MFFIFLNIIAIIFDKKIFFLFIFVVILSALREKELEEEKQKIEEVLN
jgi:hypothetical protein